MKKIVLFGLCLVVVAPLAMGNLLVNGGFETATGDSTNALRWDGSSGAGVDSSSRWGNSSRENWNTPPEGSYAVYLKGTWSGLDYGGIWQRVPISSSVSNYTITGSFYQDNGFSQTATANLKLEFYDSSYNFLYSVTTNCLTGLGNATWATRSLTTTSSWNSAFAMVVFETGGTGAGGVLGGDDFRLESTAIPEPGTMGMLLFGAMGTGIKYWRRRMK